MVTFEQILVRVAKKSVLALFVLSILVGFYFAIHWSNGAGSLVPLAMLATFVIGFLPTMLYGAPVYAAYLVYPRFPFLAVLVAAFLPGYVWSKIVSPELNQAIWMAVGPILAVLLHFLSRDLREELEQHAA